MKHLHRRIAALTLLCGFALTACGGGGTSGSLPAVSITPTPASGGGSSQLGQAKFTIVVPSSPSPAFKAARRAQYVSPNTQSIRIAVLGVNGASVSVPDTVAAIAYGAAGCSSNASQPLQCTVSAASPLGQTVTFRISTYASKDGSGSVLATSTVTTAVTPTPGAPVALSLGGVVDHVALSPKRLVAPTDGKLQTYLVSVTPIDASGAVIVGSGPFASPVALSIQNDPNGALTLTQTAISSPDQAVQLKFDSSKPLTDAKIAASTTGGGNVSADFVTLAYAPINPVVALGGAPVTVSVSEAGFTGQFSVSVADKTVATASISATANGKATITITPPPPGSYDGQTTLTVSDGTTAGTLPVKVTYPMLQMTDWYINGGPQAMAPSADGQSYFFADPALSRVAQFFPQSGTVLNVDTNMPDVAVNVTLGPDGNPWWVISGWPQTQLCKGAFFQGTFQDTCINITGTYSQANSWGLVAGPNNTLWMTLAAWQIAAIASYNITTGQFTFYSNGMSPTANPSELAYGPGGNLWFTDRNDTAPAIGKLDVASGTITEYPLQAGNGNYGTGAVPDTIVAGPDGNLWFADNSQGSPGVGKVVPSSGAVTEYSAGLQRQSRPSDIAVGPDNKLWFSDQGNESLLGTIDASSGAISEYSLSVPGFVPGPLMSLGTKLEVDDTFGIVGKPYGGYAGEVTIPGAGATVRRKNAAR